jgi:hypothetical protein
MYRMCTSFVQVRCGAAGGGWCGGFAEVFLSLDGFIGERVKRDRGGWFDAALGGVFSAG